MSQSENCNCHYHSHGRRNVWRVHSIPPAMFANCHRPSQDGDICSIGFWNGSEDAINDAPYVRDRRDVCYVPILPHFSHDVN